MISEISNRVFLVLRPRFERRPIKYATSSIACVSTTTWQFRIAFLHIAVLGAGQMGNGIT